MRSAALILPMVAAAALAQDPSASSSPDGATVKLEPKSGSQASGELMLNPSRDGVRISGTVQGLQPDAEHGFHIHERGDCSAPDASSAGAHFNPTSAMHGRPGSKMSHAGDMYNIRANEQGVAKVDARLDGVMLRDILDKAIVVHAKPDDYRSQPSGNSGDRIACGVVSPAAPDRSSHD